MALNQHDKNNRIDSLLLQQRKLHECICRAISDLNWVEDFESTFDEIERELTIAVNKIRDAFNASQIR